MKTAVFSHKRKRPTRLLRIVVLSLFVSFGAPGYLAADDEGTAKPLSEEPFETGTGFEFGFDDWRTDLGADFNGEIQSYFAALTLPLWSEDKRLLFLDSQFTWHDPLEEQVNVGLAWRQWCESFAAIIGANVFYDWGQSRHGNGFDGIGFGFEVLRNDFEVHFNYYLPQSKQPVIGMREEMDRSVHTMSSGGSVSPLGPSSNRRTVKTSQSSRTRTVSFFDNQENLVTQSSTRTRTRRNVTVMTERDFVQRFGSTKGFDRIDLREFENREAAMEGLDIEAGVPLSCLPGDLNFWIFAGYFDFNNPFGGDLNGFQGRLECRLNPNIALEAAYFSNDRLVIGENWYFGIRGSLPIDGSGNLLATLCSPQPKPDVSENWLQRIRRDRRHHMTESPFQLTRSQTTIRRTMSGGGSRVFTTKSNRSSTSLRRNVQTTQSVQIPE